MFRFIPSKARGQANYGWLRTYYSFSFAEYYNPQFIHFGALRVLNEDRIAPGYGFSMHPHNNMEIITIPLSGCLLHADSMGNSGIISSGEVQVMSAGTGILHSEKNPSKKDEVHLLQIWVFPDKKDVEPRYQHLKLPEFRLNEVFTFLGPEKEYPALWIHQKAWFSLLHIENNTQATYTLKGEKSGVYLFVVEGGIKVNQNIMKKGDAAEISDTSILQFFGVGREVSKTLIMEIPFHW